MLFVLHKSPSIKSHRESKFPPPKKKKHHTARDLRLPSTLLAFSNAGPLKKKGAQSDAQAGPSADCSWEGGNRGLKSPS